MGYGIKPFLNVQVYSVNLFAIINILLIKISWFWMLFNKCLALFSLSISVELFSVQYNIYKG